MFIETLGTGLRNIPMATEFKPEIIWRFASNSIDVKFRKFNSRKKHPIKNKHFIY